MTPAPAPLPGLPEWATDADLGDDEDLVRAYGAWAEQIVRVYRLVKGDRSGEIRGRRPKAFDDRGLHPISFEFGKAEQIWGDRVIPAVRAMIASDPAVAGDEASAEAGFAASFYLPFAIGPIRGAAKRAAEWEFAAEVGERGAEVWG